MLSDGTPSRQRVPRGVRRRGARRRAGDACARGEPTPRTSADVLSRGSRRAAARSEAARSGRSARAGRRLRPCRAARTEAGPVADGAYLVVAGVPVERLGEAGRDFVTHFATAIGRSPHPYAVYAAQAANLLLDAIARSNGTRRSVARAVLATKVRKGLTGTFAFDAQR